jgi:hypothetical protein
MTFSEDGITFEGTIGAVLLRGERTTLALGADGTIAARGQRLAGPAACQSWPAK